MWESIIMSYEHYTPLAIYENLPTLFEYRKLDLVHGSQVIEKGKVTKTKNTWLDKDEFMKTVQFYGYIIVEAKDSKERRRKMRGYGVELRKLPVTTLVILFDDTDTYTHTPEYKALILHILKIRDLKKQNLEIISVARNLPSVFLRKAIAGLEKPKGLSDGSGYIKIYSRKYIALRNINPLHVNAPKCRILNEHEEKEVLDALHADKRSLPHIFDGDGMLIWYPAEIGDIVEEMHLSESVGMEKIYRIVVATPQVEK